MPQCGSQTGWRATWSGEWYCSGMRRSEHCGTHGHGRRDGIGLSVSRERKHQKTARWESYGALRVVPYGDRCMKMFRLGQCCTPKARLGLRSYLDISIKCTNMRNSGNECRISIALNQTSCLARHKSRRSLRSRGRIERRSHQDRHRVPVRPEPCTCS